MANKKKNEPIDTVEEAVETAVEEFVEDLTDGKDNSANPWYKRWWKKYFKGVSVLAIIGASLTFGINFGVGWYGEAQKTRIAENKVRSEKVEKAKAKESAKISRIERTLTELNRNLAVMNESQKKTNEFRQDEKVERMAIWRALRSNDDVFDDLKVQVKINAILNERNYSDIKRAHENNRNNGTCQIHEKPHMMPPQSIIPDVKTLTPFEKFLKKHTGTDEEKSAIKEYEEEEAQDKKMTELLEEAKKKLPKRNAENFKNRFIKEQQQQQQQQEQEKR